MEGQSLVRRRKLCRSCLNDFKRGARFQKLFTFCRETKRSRNDTLMLDLATGKGVGVGIGVEGTGTFSGWVDVGRASGSVMGFQARQGHLDFPRLRATSLTSLIKEDH